MKKTVKNVFVICGNGKEKEEETKEKAINTKNILEEIFNTSFTIEEKQKIVYEIEKGDRVYWIKNGRVNTDRVDIVTNIEKDIFGDVRFKTKQVNGNKTGIAYEKDLSLAI